ncbi:MAG TPA: DoxX family protein [Bacteroidota bacterium]|nr:DoxX family protein [Bacteroidota bacterium]
MTAPHGERTLATDATILIRLLVGCVFLSEGVQKFLYPAALGAGRFLRIGFPWPDFLGPGVGILEIIGGELILLGLLTRPTALVLLVNISLAIISTKIPILLGHGFWGFKLPELSSYGFWSMAQGARIDAAMFLCTLFLVIAGAGSWSLDSYRNRRRE